jgi:hypothetical protein
MASCQHQYPQHHNRCPHPVPDGGTHCIWHNPLVRKNSDYVPNLLVRSSKDSNGNLEGFLLSSLFWPRAELANQNLRDADLRDAVLDHGNFAESDLTKAVLRRASFKNADLHGAILTGADLSDTNFSGANLRDCDLSYATLSGTILLGADLAGANLAGAKVSDFSWNRLTNFTGIKGLEPQKSVDDDDETQMFFAPLAMGQGESPKSDLSDPDPFRERTRVFTVPDPFSRQKRPATLAHRMTQAKTPLRLAASLLIVGGGIGAALDFLYHDRYPKTDAGPAIAASEDAKHQMEIYVEQIHELQNRNNEALAKLETMNQGSGIQAAELQKLQEAFADARAEAAKYHDSQDRAERLSRQLQEQAKLVEELAVASHRQERIAEVLATGAMRLETEKAEMAMQLEANVSEKELVAKLRSQLDELKPQLAQAERDRDDLDERNKLLVKDLVSAWKDIEHYLARVSGTALQDYLIGSETSAPLLTVTPGQSLALGGDFLITLRLESGASPNTVASLLTIQRPSSRTNPDITVALYDEHQQPLRRIAYSFPHVDDGNPFTTASTTVACDRFPHFARILVAPSMEPIAQKQ